MVEEKLKHYGKCVIIDCHSFSDTMVYTGVESINMPDICVGADKFHTPNYIVDEIVKLCRDVGYVTHVNSPFSGSLVPLSQYNKNENVISVMLEINKRLYVDDLGNKNSSFESVKQLCSEIISVIELLV